MKSNERNIFHRTFGVSTTDTSSDT